MNPNHPHYAGLGGGPNLNLLDNMLMAAGFQATDQPIVPRPAIVPQYTYAQVTHSQDVTMHQHALNLGQPHTTIAGSDPVHVIVYQQNEHQQQPISYKIPQLGTVVAQEQNFVVNDQGGQISRQPIVTSQSSRVNEAGQLTHTSQAQAITRHVQSPAERRKDIVAQAMQEQKIFEESIPKQEPIVKQEPGVTTDPNVSNSQDNKPLITATKSSPGAGVQGQRKPYQRSSNYNRQQVMPRLTILDDEDDGLTCRLCLASYWYKAEIHEHLKTVHSINDPDKYDKEEKEKKMRRMREEQQRIMLAKKQREERERRLRDAKFGRGRGTPGTIKLTSPGARPSQAPGQRPSFQYRDGAFICDLCKESFSDGNDMVTHWKSHVKKQQAEAAKETRGRPPGKGRGRGRPSLQSRNESSEEDDSDDDDDDDDDEKSKRKGKGGKGMPRWTAYLLWSTRKRRDVVVDHPDWSFAQIAKWISDEWKKIDAMEKDELQKEAEEMNELGIRKLPRDDDGPDPDKDTTDEDSDFEEGYRKKTKPIMLKIKKEKGRGDEDSDSEESDWEPEAEIMPPEREQTRSGRQRKRPSFFQEFESQENNLDSILEQFEKEQAQEFGKPRQPKPEKPPTEKKPRKPRKRKEPVITQEMLEEELEVETLRSGRKRKVRRLMTHFMEGSDEDDKLGHGASSDDDDFEPPPEEEVAKIEENDDLIEEEEEELMDEELEDEEEEDDDRLRYHDDLELPPKKRGRPKKLLTDEEIEEATSAAIRTKPVIEIVPVPRVPKPITENGNPTQTEVPGVPGELGTAVPGVGQNTQENINAIVGEVVQNAMEGGLNMLQGELNEVHIGQDVVQEALQEGFAGVQEGLDVVQGGQEVAQVSLVGVQGEGIPEGLVGVEQAALLGVDVVSEEQDRMEGVQEGGLGCLEGEGAPVPAPEELGEEGEDSEKSANTIAQVKPPWVKETLSDSEGEGDPESCDKDPSKQVQSEPLVQSMAPVTESLNTNAELNPPYIDSSEKEPAPEQFSENPLEPSLQVPEEAVSDRVDNSDSAQPPVPLTSIVSESLAPSSETLELEPVPAQTLSEEYLLTGPAHNLDDSQFKPDIVDPNLDDIFK